MVNSCAPDISTIPNPIAPAGPRHYWLTCGTCGARLEDDGVLLECPEGHPRSLLNAQYLEPHLSPATDAPGIFRYREWLPILRSGSSAARTVVYRSEALGRDIGLAELWIAFHGYWPERGAYFDTGTFKDLEAATVLARMGGDFRGVLTVASAGNTAAAFARACSRERVSCLLVVPENALDTLRFAGPLGNTVRLVAVAAPGDYSDAIALAARISALPGFQAEGGVFNVARRGGLGTVLYSAVEAIGRLPDYYLQAIGSGAGAIAVHEAAKRLIRGGRHGIRPPRQMLSQNLPFAPIYSAWRLNSRECPVDGNQARTEISQMYASVLSSRNPPYGMEGGVYDTLLESNGDMLAVGTAHARAASAWFEEREGIDIDPASAVAVASLRQAVEQGRIHRRSVVLLNITGGGRRKRCEAGPLERPRADAIVGWKELDSPAVISRIPALFS